MEIQMQQRSDTTLT